MQGSKLKFNRRLDSFLMSPMLVEPVWGLSQLIAYCDELDFVSGQVNSEILRDIWAAKKEESKMSFSIFANDQFTTSMMDSSNTMEMTNSVAIVQLRGAMRADGGLSSQGIDATVNDLRTAAASKAMGIVLRTSSGGGAVEAAQRMYSAIKEVKEVKPVVQFVDALSASGAVFAGVASDEIVMNGVTAETGSIGVVAQFDKSELEYIKENVLSIYASQSADKHSMFKNLLSGDITAVQNEYLNPVAEAFQKLVTKERKSVNKDALTGSMYLAKDAIKMGLADRIGTLNTALNRVRILSRNRNRNTNARRGASMISFNK